MSAENKRYAEYRKSGTSWIGDIPSSWQKYRLKNTLKKRITDGPHLTPEFIDEGIPFLSVDGIQEGELVFEGSRFISKDDYFEFSKKAKPEPNDILMGKAASTGKIARVKVDFDFSIWSPLALIKIDDKRFSPSYIEYCLKSPEAQYEIDRLCTSNTQKNISMDDIPSIFICAPNVEEQKAIAVFLDRETAKIDELIQKQEKLIELYGEKINALVLDGLASSETKYIRLKHVSDVISRPVSQEDEGSYKPLGLYNRGRGIFIKEERESEDMGDSDFFWVEPGDLIFSGQFAWEGSVAMAHPEHDGCVVSHRYPVIRGKEGVALTEYLLALFQTSHGDFLLNENSRGAAGRNRPLNISLLLKEKIPIIDMQSQMKIKKLIESKELFLKKSAQEIAFLKEHRASLISAAVTGKIDVRESA